MSQENPKSPWTGLAEVASGVRVSLAKKLGRERDVDDVVQEALIRAARFRHRLTREERLRPWVFRIALNVLRDALRRESRLPRVESPDDVLDLVEGRESIPGDPNDDERFELDGSVLEKSVVLRHLGRALGDLRQEDQLVLEAYYRSAQGTEEAARVCEVSEDLVRTRVHRARRRLRRSLRRRLALDPSLSSLGFDTFCRIASLELRSARCAPVDSSRTRDALRVASSE